uniref:Uncharacterized protein n=1 Tax=Arundo donax TaxID=35708 RepID=A0A0A9DZD9_ARUDO
MLVTCMQIAVDLDSGSESDRLGPIKTHHTCAHVVLHVYVATGNNRAGSKRATELHVIVPCMHAFKMDATRLTIGMMNVNA